jgi:hypothetical protein
MRLIRLALALLAMSISWVATANPAINSSVSGSVAGPTAASTQLVASQAQVRLESTRTSSESSAAGMDDSMSRGWLMALVTVLLIGHQLRRKHRFLRPQRFSNL